MPGDAKDVVAVDYGADLGWGFLVSRNNSTLLAFRRVDGSDESP